MENRLPQKIALLFSLAESMADGCHQHEVSIELAHNTEDLVLADLTAAAAAENLFHAARTAKIHAVKNHNIADKAARAYIFTARDILKPHFGTSWSQRWCEVGFIHNSLALPKAQIDRAALLSNLKAWFTEHPELEVAQLAATAAAAESHHTTVTDARGARNASRTELGQKKASRNAAVKRLRKRLRGLIAELKLLLPPDDPHWSAFGLNRPAAQPTPAAPQELKVQTSAPGSLLATWQAPPYGKRSHVFKQVLGVDPDFIPAASTKENEVILNGFTSGTTVRLRVTAVNDAGESAPCEAVEQTVP